MSINAYRESIVDFGIDTRGWRWFQRIANVGQRGINGAIGSRYSVAKGTAQVTFNGLTKSSPQHFAGIAPLGMGKARPIRGTTMLPDTISTDPLNDAALRVFAERLRRGR